MKCIIALILIIICDFSYSQNKDHVVIDIEGNIYNTITIGSQIWMKENLKTRHYRNGDEIATTNPDSLDLTNEFNPKFQWSYKSSDSLANIYGRIYTWYAVVDKRNICPEGWHVPSDEEFCILENFLEPDIDSKCDKMGHRGTFLGNALKEPGQIHWINHDTGADNSSGFTGISQVIRTLNGNFRFFGLYAYYWTSTEFDSKQAWSRRLYHDSKDVKRGYYFKKDALSVRCIKD